MQSEQARPISTARSLLHHSLVCALCMMIACMCHICMRLCLVYVLNCIWKGVRITTTHWAPPGSIFSSVWCTLPNGPSGLERLDERIFQHSLAWTKSEATTFSSTVRYVYCCCCCSCFCTYHIKTVPFCTYSYLAQRSKQYSKIITGLPGKNVVNALQYVDIVCVALRSVVCCVAPDACCHMGT